MPRKPALTDEHCPLCAPSNEHVLLKNDILRIILPDEPAYPGFVRVVLNAHIAEMTDLPPQAQRQVMDTVLAVETVLRSTLQPDKINLASLGNYVPHLHWHVIPRYRDDATWPDAVWAEPHRTSPSRAVDPTQLRIALQKALGDSSGTGNAAPAD